MGLPLTAANYTLIQERQEAAMFSTCVHEIWTQNGTDEYGMPQTMFVDGATYSCGMAAGDSGRLAELLGATEVGVVDMRLTMPLAIETLLNERDRLRITKVNGRSLENALVFEVRGVVARWVRHVEIEVSLVTEVQQ